MIIDSIIQMVTEVVAWVVGFLPTSPAPPAMRAAVDSMVASLSTGLGAADTWIDLGVLASVLVLAVTWRAGIASFRLVVWIFALLHLGGTT